MLSMGTEARHRPLPVKGYLVNQGVTIKDLARRLGYAREHVVRVLNRQEPLTRDLAVAIASELGLGVDETALLLGSPATWASGRRRQRVLLTGPPPEPVSRALWTARD